MERRRTVDVNGVQMGASEIGFRSSGEHWNEYLLDDGSVVRLKVVVTGIVKVDDLYDEEGYPAYMLKSTNVLSVSAPEELRKKD